MKLIGALWNAFNGKKLNTGTVVVLAAILMQNYLGIGHDQAVSIATEIMAGVGGVLVLVGYIHRLFKAKGVPAK